ncbi:MAG: hypothetical protein K5866_05540 [Treponema sp.]|nr:hypothetical protein [Treponema sp.]
MKKIVFIALILLAGILTSCASIPSKVKPGDTLVVGKMEVKAHDYKYSERTGIDLNATYTYNIEITIKDIISGKEFPVMTNEDGFFFVKGLKAHTPYAISKVMVTAYSMSGWYTTFGVTLNTPPEFVPYDNQVVNIGATYFDADGSKSYWTSQTSNHYLVKEYFEELSEGSEWASKNIVDWKFNY